LKTDKVTLLIRDEKRINVKPQYEVDILEEEEEEDKN
jgi:hypothetical protein